MAQVPGMPTIYDLANGGSVYNQPTLTPRQQEIQNQVLETGAQRLQNPTQGFDPIAAQARNEFYTDTLPSLAERFNAGMGGNVRSSGLNRELNRAGSQFNLGLAAQQALYGLQQQGLAQNQVNTGLQQQYGQSIWQPQDNQIGGQLTSLGGKALEAYLKAPGGSPTEKLKNALGIASGATATNLPTPASTTAGTTPAPVAASANEGKSLTELAAPAVGTATNAVTNAGKIASNNPALAQAVANKAVGGAASGLGWEAAIAPALAAGGAIAMPIAVGGLFAWWLYKLIND